MTNPIDGMYDELKQIKDIDAEIAHQLGGSTNQPSSPASSPINPKETISLLQKIVAALSNLGKTFKVNSFKGVASKVEDKNIIKVERLNDILTLFVNKFGRFIDKFIGRNVGTDLAQKLLRGSINLLPDIEFKKPSFLKQTTETAAGIQAQHTSEKLAGFGKTLLKRTYKESVDDLLDELQSNSPINKSGKPTTGSMSGTFKDSSKAKSSATEDFVSGAKKPLTGAGDFLKSIFGGSSAEGVTASGGAIAEGAVAEELAGFVGALALTTVELGTLTAGVGIVIGAFALIGAGAVALGEKLKESQKYLVQFNGQIALAFGRSQQREIGRNITRGQETGESTAKLVNSLDNLKDAFAPITNALINFANNIIAPIINIVASITALFAKFITPLTNIMTTLIGQLSPMLALIGPIVRLLAGIAEKLGLINDNAPRNLKEAPLNRQIAFQMGGGDVRDKTVINKKRLFMWPDENPRKDKR